MLLILILIPVINVFVAGGTLQSRNNVCKTETCIKTAKRLNYTMNRTHDPCDNFYEYTCGNYGKFVRKETGNKIIPPSLIVASQILLDFKVEEILNSSITDTEPEALQKAKVFFRSCLDTDSMNSKGILPLRKILRKMSISPSLYFTGKTGGFDWILAAVMYKKFFNRDFLFSVNVRPEPGNPDSNFITIERPIEDEANFPQIVSKKNRVKQNFMKKRPILLGEKAAGSEMSAFIEDVAKLIDADFGMENLTNYAEHLRLKTALLIYLQKQNIDVMKKTRSSGLSPKIMTLQELQNFTDAVPSMIKGKTIPDTGWRFVRDEYVLKWTLFLI